MTPTPEQLARTTADRLACNVDKGNPIRHLLHSDLTFAEREGIAAIILSTFGERQVVADALRDKVRSKLDAEREINRQLYSKGDDSVNALCHYSDGRLDALVSVIQIIRKSAAPQSQPAVTVSRSCPCRHGEPCFHGCTCVNPHSSQGCSFCCTYGSAEQQKVRAEHLRKLILLGIEAEKKAQPAVCVKCGLPRLEDKPGWVTVGTIKTDIETETETFTRACRCEFPQEGEATLSGGAEHQGFLCDRCGEWVDRPRRKEVDTCTPCDKRFSSPEVVQTPGGLL